jgi:hypothetical protein
MRSHQIPVARAMSTARHVTIGGLFVSKASLRSIEMRVELSPEFARNFTLRPLVEGDQAVYELIEGSVPPVAVKTFVDGDRVEIRRINEGGVHVISAVYYGTLEDLGAARFALDNVWHDLADSELLDFPTSISFATDKGVGKEAA